MPGLFQVFPVLFGVMFVLVFGMIVVQIVHNVGQWSKDNRSPRLTVEATVISRRTEVRRTGNGASSTRYYATFQVESGDRIELAMKGDEYGMLAEGDRGKLSFQGSRYLGFERI